MSYQLEPALAVLRHGAGRVLIADDVGLGKTVEAGLIVREIAMRQPLSRTLVVSPAAVRDQWKHELSQLFEISVVDADAAWLRRASRDLPSIVNPWSLPGVYLASLDFVKRAETLHALEEVRWDLLVVDEAHAATPGSDRHAAIHAVACRSRSVVLLTATPHSGNDNQFVSLCAIGGSDESPPMLLFNRTRADARLENQTRPSRSRLLSVRQTVAEQRTHRLLEDYTARVWAESTSRSEAKGTLVATVLRKRALSSLTSLALSLRRRLHLLSNSPSIPSQLVLPLWREDQIDEDSVADALLVAAALGDQHLERRMLTALAEQSEQAQRDDSKVRTLTRFLRRVREPAIVFTEYRDTAEHLSRALTAAGHRVCLLHGGLARDERSAVLTVFRSRQSVLVATDAASEGLNLHHHCRLVVHFELPWTPARLHQRRGRVDRIGQMRPVHEVALVASDTCEQLVLAPLLQRAIRSRPFAGSPLVNTLPESRVAALILGGMPMSDSDQTGCSLHVPLPKWELDREAREEVARLSELRRLASSAVVSSCRPERHRIVPITTSRKRPNELGATLTLVLGVSLQDGSGGRCDQHALLVSLDLVGIEWHRRHLALRQQVQYLLSQLRPLIDPVVRQFIDNRITVVFRARALANQRVRERDGHLQHQLRSTAREMVQAGLFDRRAMRTVAARDRSRAIALEDHAARGRSGGESRDHVEGAYVVLGVRVGRSW